MGMLYLFAAVLMTVFQLLAVLFLEMEQDDFANNPRTARPAENLKTVPKKIC